jgi:hypothetical protein
MEILSNFGVVQIVSKICRNHYMSCSHPGPDLTGSDFYCFHIFFVVYHCGLCHAPKSQHFIWFWGCDILIYNVNEFPLIMKIV